MADGSRPAEAPTLRRHDGARSTLSRWRSGPSSASSDRRHGRLAEEGGPVVAALAFLVGAWPSSCRSSISSTHCAYGSVRGPAVEMAYPPAWLPDADCSSSADMSSVT